jgi:hypothetical protein
MALLMILMVSCEKDTALTPNVNFNDPNASTTPSGGSSSGGCTMAALVDGSIINFPVADWDTAFFKTFKITGQFSNFIDYRYVRFEFDSQDFPTTGTYPIGLGSGDVFARYESSVTFSLNDSTIYDGISGSITFTTATPAFYEGNYLFVAENLITLEKIELNGSFNACPRI